MTPQDKIQIGYCLCAALGLLFGMIIMACARMDQSNLNSEDSRDEKALFDIWEEE